MMGLEPTQVPTLVTGVRCQLPHYGLHSMSKAPKGGLEPPTTTLTVSLPYQRRSFGIIFTLYLSMTIGANQRTLLSFRQHSFPRSTKATCCNAELFIFWIVVMKLKCVLTLVITTPFTLSSKVFNKSSFSFASTFADSNRTTFFAAVIPSAFQYKLGHTMMFAFFSFCFRHNLQ